MSASRSSEMTAAASPPRAVSDPAAVGGTEPSWARLSGLLAVAAMLALGVVYLWVLLTTPFDGTVVAGNPPFQLSHGSLVLAPIGPTHGLTGAARVVAIEGRGMASWVGALRELGTAQPHWRIGQTLMYTVLLHGQATQVPVRLGTYPVGVFWRASWGTLLFAAAFLTVAVFVFARRPHDRIALPLLLCAAALFPATLGYLGVSATFLTLAPAFWLHIAAAVLAHVVFLAALVHAALLLPRPHPLTLRWRWLIPLVYAAPMAAYVVYLAPTWPGRDALAWFAGWSALGQVVFVVYLALVVGVIVSAYQLHRDTVTRQQIRWVVYGGVIAAGSTLLLNALPILFGVHLFLTANAIGALQTVFPITLAIAILRYRLFDIDVIIHRTLVYGTLTGTLALVYFGSVALLQLGFRAMTGQTQPAAVVLSTLAIAALFQPLRRRIQTVIDRRFFRAKYDATRTIEAFSMQLRDEVDLSQLRSRLIDVVADTMQPLHASLWIHEPTTRERAPAEWGVSSGERAPRAEYTEDHS